MSIHTFANIFFWFLVILAGYWFIFFKLQQRVYILIPTVNYSTPIYYSFNAVFGTVIATKLVSLLYKIYFEQCSFDIFLIDWEKPKPRQDMKNNIVYGVNAWRQLLVLNEFTELQTYKVISVELTLIVYAFFMDGLGWRYLANQTPELETKESSSPYNYVLNFFVTAIILHIIGVVQYILRYAIKLWNPLPVEEFTDLCAISNISVLMFDSDFRGYYIHGRSPYG